MVWQFFLADSDLPPQPGTYGVGAGEASDSEASQVSAVAGRPRKLGQANQPLDAAGPGHGREGGQAAPDLRAAAPGPTPAAGSGPGGPAAGQQFGLAVGEHGTVHFLY